jgi:hypothetical protein
VGEREQRERGEREPKREVRNPNLWHIYFKRGYWVELGHVFFGSEVRRIGDRSLRRPASVNRF